MSDIKQGMSSSMIIILVTILGLVLILSYEAFKSSPTLSYLGLTIALFLVVWIFVDNTEYNPLGINRNVLSINGEMGTEMTPLRYIGNREYSMVIACKRRYAPKSKKGYMEGIAGVMTYLTGNINIELRGGETDFFEVKSTATCPEGTVIYLKDFSGRIPDNSPYKELQEKNNKKDFIISKLATYVSELQGQVITEGKESRKSMMDVIQSMSTIIKQLQVQDRQPPVSVEQQPNKQMVAR